MHSNGYIQDEYRDGTGFKKALASKKAGVFPNLHNDKMNLKVSLVTVGRQSCPKKKNYFWLDVQGNYLSCVFQKILENVHKS